MSEPKVLVQLKQTAKVYGLPKRPVVALSNVTFDVQSSEFVSIMGPSGSGKSTLLHLIGCLDTPTSGEYLFDGIPVHRLGRNRLAELRNQKIGFVFQTFHLLPRVTALENVALPLVYRNLSKKAQRDRAMAMLERVGLQERAHHAPSELSGGERQRVAIARALVGDPALILADEPTGNLDVGTSAQIINLLDEIRYQTSVAILLVTHDPHVAQRAERVIQMQNGTLLGSPDVHYSSR